MALSMCAATHMVQIFLEDYEVPRSFHGSGFVSEFTGAKRKVCVRNCRYF
jgi:hypothetical protein